METEQEQFDQPIQDTEVEEPRKVKNSSNAIIIGSAMISVALVASVFIYVSAAKRPAETAAATNPQTANISALENAVIPQGGITLPVVWGDLGKKMVAAGVIDETQFNALYASRGGVPTSTKALLDNADNGNLVITQQNAGTLLNLLWAFGLSNKNPILEKGPMQNPQYGGAANFASTGGWTLAVGSAMNHYSAHPFVTLTADQQSLVETVSKNIYRPCCGNSTYFPDCNHGMAMLGLLELMAAQGATDSEMYQAALVANSYWFPDTYLTIAQYFASKGVNWSAVDPKTVLGANYSSAQGYQTIQSQIQPVQGKSSGGCGVQ